MTPGYGSGQPQTGATSNSGVDAYYREVTRQMQDRYTQENGPLAQILKVLAALAQYGTPDAQMAGRAAAGPYGLQQMYDKMGLNSVTQGLMTDATSAFAPGSALNQDPRYAGQQYGVAQLLAAQGAANEAGGAYQKAYDVMYPQVTYPSGATGTSAPYGMPSRNIATSGLTPWQQQVAYEEARRRISGITEATGWSLGSSGRNRGAYGPDGTFYPSGETFG